MKTMIFSALLFFFCGSLPAAEQKGPRLGSDLRINLAKQKSGSRKFKLAPVQAEDEKPAPQIYCIYGAQSGKPFGDLAAFKSVIWMNDVIYLGGLPDRQKDQEARLEALKSLREARGSRIAVGFEAINLTRQSVLDDYAAEKISEEEFLRKSGWEKEPGYDFAPYRPIFSFIIKNKLRALALNVPGETIYSIQRDGVDGLSEEEKNFLPAQISTGTRSGTHKKYLEFLKSSFSPPAAGAAPGALTWDNHLAAISFWNEAAGARIADFVNANPGWSVLVAAGNDRLIYNAALPASVKSRTVKLRQASFYAEDAAACPAALPKNRKDLANYIWYSTPIVVNNE